MIPYHKFMVTEKFKINFFGDGLALQGAAVNGAYELLNYFGMKNVQVANGRQNPYSNKTGTAPVSDPVLKTSLLGTPILTNLVIAAGNYVDANGVTQSWPDLEIDNIIMTVSQQKKIVVTEIQGRDNDVKEYIGLHDYQVDLKGGIFGSYNQFPKTDVNNLKKALASPQPLAFASWWLQNLYIDTVVVFAFNFPQTEGEYSSQYFTATVHSDVPTEILITGNA